MLRAFVLNQIDKTERAMDEPLDYLRDMVRASLRQFLTFAFRSPIAWHRRTMPAAPYHVARLVAVRHEDCGTCVRTVVNLGLADGVPRETMRAALEGRIDDLQDGVADAYRFATAVVEATGDEGQYRDRLVERFGKEALVELALGIAGAQVYPVTKRALGHATSCALVHVTV